MDATHVSSSTSRGPVTLGVPRYGLVASLSCGNTYPDRQDSTKDAGSSPTGCHHEGQRDSGKSASMDLHLCVHFCPVYFGGSPSDQGETGTTLCSVSRGSSVYFPVQLEPTGVTQKGVNTGIIFVFLCFFYTPPSSCGACLHFDREKGSAVPIPHQQQGRILSTHEAFQL